MLRVVPADLAYDTPTVFRYTSIFSGKNETLADNSWDGIDVSPVTVALSDDWVRDHNLDASLRFPWDNEKGLYFLKVFHSLHCLVGHYFGCSAIMLMIL